VTYAAPSAALRLPRFRADHVGSLLLLAPEVGCWLYEARRLVGLA